MLSIYMYVQIIYVGYVVGSGLHTGFVHAYTIAITYTEYISNIRACFISIYEIPPPTPRQG